MSLQLLVIQLPTIVLALVVHEYAHAWTAVRLGDPTPRWAGRLTLNPLKHLSVLGTLMIFIVGIGWANPVVVNPRNLREPKRDMMLIALAGPASNLVLAAGFALLFHVVRPILPPTSLGWMLAQFFVYGAYINAVLMVFNMIPLPPLDGSKVLSRFLAPKWNYSFLQLGQYGFVILFILLYFFDLGRGIRWAASGILRIFGL